MKQRSKKQDDMLRSAAAMLGIGVVINKSQCGRSDSCTFYHGEIWATAAWVSVQRRRNPFNSLRVGTVRWVVHQIPNSYRDFISKPGKEVQAFYRTCHAMLHYLARRK